MYSNNYFQYFLILILSFLTIPILHAAELPVGFVEKLVAQNLDPTDMVIAPDGRVLITIKSGKILVVQNDVLLNGSFLDINTQVDNSNERGLGHMVLDPNFESNNYYYVYYTVKGQNRNRVSRFTANGNSTIPGSEVVLLDVDPLFGTIHNGGAMVFGQDGMLYISIGDGSYGITSQSLTTLLGKVIRMNPYGSTPEQRIPSDNPFPNLNGNYKLIWALGFRNPFSMGIDPLSGDIYISEVGGGAFEEINKLEKGKNYGWPEIEGLRTNATNLQNYTDPLHAYPHGGGFESGCSIMGSAFYNFQHFPSGSFPAAYRGKYFFADYCNGYIRMYDPATKAVLPEIFAKYINRPLSIRIAPDGSMYYLARAGLGGGSQEDNTSTNSGTLWKITYTGSGVPTIASQPQNVSIPEGEDATFIVSASGTPPLQYQWQINQNNVQGANSASFTFQNAALSDNGKQIRCKVSNSFGEVFSNAATLQVSANKRPIPQISITLPDAASLYQGGHTLQFSGSATDPEDGTVPTSALEWKIDFHHDDHFHPGMGWTAGLSSGSYVIPRIGETSDNVWYRVYLKATDQQGFSQTIFKEVFPKKTQITLQTDPPGLNLILDGAPVQTPYVFNSVVGITRYIEAQLTQPAANKYYVFDKWQNNSTENAIVFDAPTNNVTFTATFQELPIGQGNGLEAFYFSNQLRTLNGSPTLSRTDTVVNFNWGGDSPAPQISKDSFTARWLGEISPIITGVHTFYLTADDGIRLWVNDQLLIDKWVDQATTEWTGEINLIAGQRYPVKIEYFENGGDALIEFAWSNAKVPREIVPKRQLFSGLLTPLEPAQEQGIFISPNPVNEELFVKMERPQSIRWALSNVWGQVIAEGKNDRDFSIRTKDLPVGVYFLLITEPFKSVIRFVKE